MKPENYAKLHTWLRELQELEDISVDATATEIEKLIDSEVTGKMTELARLIKAWRKAGENMPVPAYPYQCCAICRREIYQNAYDGTWLHSPIYAIDHDAVPQSDLCPQCGAHLALWKEVFGEEHQCYVR